MADLPEPAAAATAPTDATDSADAMVERRIVTVLFADLVGFTPLSERLDAEDVAMIQDAYFAAVRETIARYGGVLEKFIGDAAMAVFGAPRTRDDDAERAVRAGLALIGAVEQVGARLGLEPGELQLRVGVNSGEVVHATVGPDAGRVTGDTVNTAARLQTAADPGSVLLGELTALSVAESIETVEVGPIQLKGKADAVRPRRAAGVRAHASREEALGRLRAPLIGRDAELARLTAALAAAAQGRAARVLVVAPPGVGKSRLLAELGAPARARDGGTEATVLRARVRPQATAPYETVAQLLADAGPDRLPETLAAAGISEARAGVVAGEANRLLAPARGPATAAAGGDLTAERDARFEAWVTALDALCEGPALWLVEDVHWAGGDLLAFLDHAGRAPTDRGRLVVTTARPSLLEAAPAWCETDRLDLAPLPATDAAELVDALLGPGVLPDAVVRIIVERSDGTPLFIEELIRTWISVGTLMTDGDGWRLAVEPGAVPMPPTVQAIYAAQLDDLPPDARAVARRGSVAGRRVPVGALDALEVSGQHAGLDALRRRAFVAGPFRDAVTGEAYAYRHALLRDAGYASLARAERARLHLAMARWLVAVSGPAADVVAEAVAEHHAAALASRPALGGGLPERDELASEAARWYERAAEAALRLSAHEAADRLLARSVELTEDAPIELARRRLRRGEVLAASANLDVGIGEMRAALEAAAGDDALSAHAAYSLARALMQQIGFGEAEQLTASTLERGARVPAGERARLHALHAWAVSAQGRADGVLEEASLAETLAGEAGMPAHGLDVLEHVATARDEVGADTTDDWRRLEEAARALGRWQQVAAAMRVQAMHRAMDDPAAALPGLENAGEVARTHGLAEAAGWADYARAEALWVLGRWDEAVEVGSAAVAVAERYAYDRLGFRTFVVLLPIAAVRHDAGLAGHYRRWWQATDAGLPASPSPYARILRAAIGAWLAETEGAARPAPPDGITEAIVPMANPHFLAATETVVEGLLATGRLAEASEAGERVAEFASETDATGHMRASARLIAAWIAAAQGEMASAHAAAREAEDLARAIPAPWWVNRARRARGAAG